MLSLAAREGNAPEPELGFLRNGDTVDLFWSEEGWTLQRRASLAIEGEEWRDVPGSQTNNPWRVAAGEGAFFRLRK